MLLRQVGEKVNDVLGRSKNPRFYRNVVAGVLVALSLWCLYLHYQSTVHLLVQNRKDIYQVPEPPRLLATDPKDEEATVTNVMGLYTGPSRTRDPDRAVKLAALQRSLQRLAHSQKDVPQETDEPERNILSYSSLLPPPLPLIVLRSGSPPPSQPLSSSSSPLRPSRASSAPSSTIALPSSTPGAASGRKQDTKMGESDFERGIVFIEGETMAKEGLATTCKGLYEGMLRAQTEVPFLASLRNLVRLFTVPYVNADALKMLVQNNTVLAPRFWRPVVDMSVYSRDEQIIAFAKEHDVDVFNDAEYSEVGVPTVRSMFNLTEERYSADFFGYVNSDILFSPHGLVRSLRAVKEAIHHGFLREKVLMVGQRTNSDWTLDDDLVGAASSSSRSSSASVSPSAAGAAVDAFDRRLREKFETGRLFNKNAEDYFIITKNAFDWATFPGYVIGRIGYDNMWVDRTYHEGQVDMIDLTITVPAIHQTGIEGNKAGSTIKRAVNDTNYNLNKFKNDVGKPDTDHGKTYSGQYRTLMDCAFTPCRLVIVDHRKHTDYVNNKLLSLRDQGVINLAEGKPCRQSSQKDNKRSCKQGNDGVFHKNDECVHTHKMIPEGWWQVDLGTPAPLVTRIVVKNRELEHALCFFPVALMAFDSPPPVDIDAGSFAKAKEHAVFVMEAYDDDVHFSQGDRWVTFRLPESAKRHRFWRLHLMPRKRTGCPLMFLEFQAWPQ